MFLGEVGLGTAEDTVGEGGYQFQFQFLRFLTAALDPRLDLLL